MRTYVYVDAFNLYYGCLKRTPYKWLDLHKLCELLLPKNKVERIKYFTAQVKALPDNPDAPRRQQAYLRALRTLPDLEIILGHFLTHEVKMPLARPEPGKSKFVSVIKTEEKGSDVNLAVHLLNDAFRNLYDCAVVISGDSDLLGAVQIVTLDIGKTIGVLNPQQRTCQVLAKHASFYKHIREGVLKISQFPDQMMDKNGTLSKPAGW